MVAAQLYGYEHRPYGYLCGGSGGACMVLAAAEHTLGVWDGFVPFVTGHPLAIPNDFSARLNALRILNLSPVAIWLMASTSSSPPMPMLLLLRSTAPILRNSALSVAYGSLLPPGSMASTTSAHWLRWDWYRTKARKARATAGRRLDDDYRLWFTDHAQHGIEGADSTRTVSYAGVLQQALPNGTTKAREVSRWRTRSPASRPIPVPARSAA